MQSRNIYYVKLTFHQQFSAVYEFYIDDAVLREAKLFKPVTQHRNSVERSIFEEDEKNTIKNYLADIGSIIKLHISDIHSKNYIILHFKKEKIKKETQSYVVYTDFSGNVKTSTIKTSSISSSELNLPICEYDVFSPKVAIKLPEPSFAFNLAQFKSPDNFYVKLPHDFFIEDAIQKLEKQAENFFKIANVTNHLNLTLHAALTNSIPIVNNKTKENENEENAEQKNDATSLLQSEIQHSKLAMLTLINELTQEQKKFETTFYARLNEIIEIDKQNRTSTSTHARLVGALRNTALQYAIKKIPASEKIISDTIVNEINKKFKNVAAVQIVTINDSHECHFEFDSSLANKNFDEIDKLADTIHNICMLEKTLFSTADKILYQNYFNLKNSKDIKQEIKSESKTLFTKSAANLFAEVNVEYTNALSHLHGYFSQIIALRITLFTQCIQYFETIRDLFKQKIEKQNKRYHKLSKLINSDNTILNPEKLMTSENFNTIEIVLNKFIEARELLLTSNSDNASNLLSQTNTLCQNHLETVTKAATELETSIQNFRQTFLNEKQKIMQEENERKLSREQLAKIFQPTQPTIVEEKKSDQPKQPYAVKLNYVISICLNLDFWHKQVWARGKKIKLSDASHKGKEISVPTIIYDLLKIFSSRVTTRDIIKGELYDDKFENIIYLCNEMYAQETMREVYLEVTDAIKRNNQRRFGFVVKDPTKLFINEVKRIAIDKEATCNFTSLLTTINLTNKKVLAKHKHLENYTIRELDLDCFIEKNDPRSAPALPAQRKPS